MIDFSFFHPKNSAAAKEITGDCIHAVAYSAILRADIVAVRSDDWKKQQFEKISTISHLVGKRFTKLTNDELLDVVLIIMDSIREKPTGNYDGAGLVFLKKYHDDSFGINAEWIGKVRDLWPKHKHNYLNGIMVA
ncbi:TPA: hypothetical protein IG158_004529 [Escherichia coli]|nr:hypothetical protein [Escherichia coli]